MGFWEHQSWKQGVLKHCQAVAHKAAETTADALNTLGTLACATGGIGIIASYAVNEDVQVSYFGMAQSQGTVQISIDAAEFNMGHNQTIPFQFNREMSGGVAYNLKNALSPSEIRFFSAICISSGTLLKLLGSNLKQWNQSRKDISYLKKKEQITLTSPSWSEYAHANLASFFGSCSYTLFSLGVADVLFQYEHGLTGSGQAITYPIQGEPAPQGSNYSGPLKTQQFDINKQFIEDGTFHFPDDPSPINFTTTLTATGNATVSFGEKLTFKPEQHTANIAAFLLPTAVLTYWAGSFFANKAERQRDMRIRHADEIKRLYDEEENPLLI